MLVIWWLLFPLFSEAFKPSHPICHETVERESSLPPPFLSKSSTYPFLLTFYLSSDGILTANQNLKIHTFIINESAEIKKKQLLFVAHQNSNTVFYRSPVHGKVIQLFVENGQIVPGYSPILQLLKNVTDDKSSNKPIMPIVSETSEEEIE